MTTTILGGGAAQPAKSNALYLLPAISQRPAGFRNYIEGVKPTTLRAKRIAVSKLIEPVSLALSTIDDATTQLQAALSIPQDHPNYPQLFRNAVKAALDCLDDNGNDVDCEFESLFTKIKGAGND